MIAKLKIKKSTIARENIGWWKSDRKNKLLYLPVSLQQSSVYTFVRNTRREIEKKKKNKQIWKRVNDNNNGKKDRFTVGLGTGDGRNVGRVNDRRVRAPVERIVLRFVILDALLSLLLCLLLLVINRRYRRVSAPRHLGHALVVVHLRPGYYIYFFLN